MLLTQSRMCLIVLWQPYAARQILKLTNLLSRICMQCGQAVGRQMMEQNRVREGRGGVIINMSSVNGVTAIPSIAGYNASKGGIDNLTK